MKTVGEILAEKRRQEGIKIQQVMKATKIRVHLIQAIEKNEFAKLPSASTAYGFIKNYAQFLGLSPRYVLAVFRRDFCEDKRGRIIPRGLIKPLDSPKVFQLPRLGVIALTGLFIVLVVAYLGWQYYSLVRGPFIRVFSPPENQSVFLSFVTVQGETEPDASVRINNEIVNVAPEGSFQAVVDLSLGENKIVIEAENKLGKSREMVLTITRDQ